MTVDGINAANVGEWLGRHVEVAGELHYDLITGGRSNLTYGVSDDSGLRWVLRRPPLHSVLSSAHDVGREHRIMAALQGSSVPVPPLVGLESDPTVNGASFYVMEFVEGLVPRDVDAITSYLDQEAREAVAFSLADTLADLHAVDVDEVGLGDLARREEYIARQLKRWNGQYEAGSLRDLPLVGELHGRFLANIPEQVGTSIVHGDYRLDNTIVGPDGQLRAVLDWELCTLGDPLADLGLLVVYWAPPSGAEMPMIPAAGHVPGMPSIDQVIARYADRSGRDLDELGFYVAFGFWKLAIILEGVYTRFASGAYGEPDGSHEAFGEMVKGLLELSHESATEVGR